MRYLIFSIFLFFAIQGHAQSGDEAQIRQILSSQTASWNKGDLDEFMQGYWHSDSLMFIGKNGITWGYANALANYKKNYSNADQMGQLSFELLKFDRISEDHYFVIGKWFLKRKAGDIGGIYSLLFKKIGGRWWIVADHSS
jgi:ketosteroid isomerase-like protein